MERSRLLVFLGLFLIAADFLLPLSGIHLLDAYPAATYRGYTIYYSTETHVYYIAGIPGTYSTLDEAKAAIDEYLGPPPPENQDPHAECDGPYSGYVGETIYFYSTGSSDPDGDKLTYKWKFGDGSTATGSSPGHVYKSPGTYTVTLIVEDGRGGKDTDTTKCYVYEKPSEEEEEEEPPPPPPEPNQPPVARITAPTSGRVGEKIYFSASKSYDPDGSIIGYKWNFGDGSTSTKMAPTHTYSQPGSYTVKLKVTDDDGATDTATVTIRIEDIPRIPDGYFSINGSKVGKTDTLTFKKRVIEITFTATENADVIDDVEVYVNDQKTLTLKKISSSKWTGRIEFTRDGRYEIEGYVVYDDDKIRLLSIVAQVGSGAFISSPGMLTFAGFGLMLLGIIVRRKAD